jgi:hypothetical protein
LCIPEQTANFALYGIQWQGVITEMASIYCVAQTESLNNTNYILSLKGSLYPSFDTEIS